MRLLNCSISSVLPSVEVVLGEGNARGDVVLEGVVEKRGVDGKSVKDGNAVGRHPKVNLSPRGVGNVVNRQLAEATPGQLSQHGADVYIERLEMMLRAAWPQAIQGNLKAVMVVLRVLKQEAKFYGLDDGPDGLTPGRAQPVGGVSAAPLEGASYFFDQACRTIRRASSSGTTS